jgi:hypothetical protein
VQSLKLDLTGLVSLQMLGQAIAQLDVNWGVDYEPFKDHPARDCFNLTIQVNN